MGKPLHNPGSMIMFWLSFQKPVGAEAPYLKTKAATALPNSPDTAKMKKLLEKFVVFQFTLRFIAFVGQRPALAGLTQWLTTQSALLNIKLNKPRPATNTAALSQTWQELMPPEAKGLFPIKETDEQTAYVEIHVHCPLRGTGNNHACHKLMNYDRKLMEKVGGQLIVLESQSNSGKPYCRLAIRKAGAPTDDLTPAFQE